MRRPSGRSLTKDDCFSPRYKDCHAAGMGLHAALTAGQTAAFRSAAMLGWGGTRLWTASYPSRWAILSAERLYSAQMDGPAPSRRAWWRRGRASIEPSGKYHFAVQRERSRRPRPTRLNFIKPVYAASRRTSGSRSSRGCDGLESSIIAAFPTGPRPPRG